MKALTISEDRTLVVKDVPVPPPFLETHVLIKVKAISANPTDWKHIDYGLGPVGSIIGCDAAGEIVKLGKNEDQARAITEKYGYQIGDSITGTAHGGSVLNPENGAIAEYVWLDAGVSNKFVPLDKNESDSSLGVEIPGGEVVNSFEKAASLPVSLYTSVLVLAINFSKEINFSNDQWQDSDSTLLLNGGATAFGLNFLQINKLIKGFKNVITVASKKHESLLKSFGVVENFDYNNEGFLNDIIEKYPKTKNIMDAVSTEKTYKNAYVTATKLAKKGSKTHVVNLMGFTSNMLPDELKADDIIEESSTLLYLVNGLPVPFGSTTFPASPEYRKTALTNIPKLTKIIDNGNLKTIAIKINAKRGFDGAIDAIDGIRKGNNRGEKFVVKF